MAGFPEYDSFGPPLHVMTRLSTIPPVFIVGCPRSGTTVLADLMRDTPWGVPFETLFIPKYYRRLASPEKIAGRRSCRSLVKRILAERPIRQRAPETDADSLFYSLQLPSYANIVDAICLACRRDESALTWADKSPWYRMHLSIVDTLFPKSRFIWIIRDGRDVALSLMKRPWGPASVFGSARLWRRFHQPCQTVEQLQRAGRLFALRYEDLLKTPEETVPVLRRFLGVDTDTQHTQSWLRKLNRSNHGKWTSEMTPAQVATFESVAGDVLERMGYARSQPEQGEVSVTERRLSILRDRLKHCRHLVRINVVDTVAISLFGKEPFREQGRTMK